MQPVSVKVEKPQRWDEPFGPDMTAADVDEILATDLFRDIDPELFPPRLPLRGILLNDTRIDDYRDGDIIVRRGDYGNSAFLVLSGSIRIDIGSADKRIPDSMLGRSESRGKGVFGAIAQLWRNPRWPEARLLGGERRETDLGAYRTGAGGPRIFLDVPTVLERFTTVQRGSGTIFGEIAALGRTPRTATVFAEGDTRLLEIRWQGLRELRKYAPSIKMLIDQRYRESSLQVHLSEVPFFQHLSNEALDKIKDVTLFETYGDFDWYGSYKQLAEKDAAERLRTEPIIAEEGHYPNGVYLIRGGFARVSRRFANGHLTLSYLGQGQSYGWREIAHNWRFGADYPLQTTLRTVGYLDVLFVPTAVIEQEVLPTLPEAQFPAPLDISRSEATTPRETESDLGISSSTLEFLVENRFINGTATMLIDLDLCTRCDDCVRACAAAHQNNPRFLRSGPQFSHYMVANACMHCTDPVCMIGCPTGAISRNTAGGEVTINDQTCIGCGTCANNCPYDAIRMVEIRDRKGNVLLDEQSAAPIRKATKCDLCAEQLGGPACQRACPHAALQRTNMSDLGSLAKWLNR